MWVHCKDVTQGQLHRDLTLNDAGDGSDWSFGVGGDLDCFEEKHWEDEDWDDDRSSAQNQGCR